MERNEAETQSQAQDTDLCSDDFLEVLGLLVEHGGELVVLVALVLVVAPQLLAALDRALVCAISHKSALTTDSTKD